MTIRVDAADDDHASDVGSVRLHGVVLEVTAPQAMSATAARRLAARLELHAGAKSAPDCRSISVPVRHGATLSTELADVWPGSQWKWTWTASAEEAAARAANTQLQLRRSLPGGASPKAEDQLLSILAAGGFVRRLLPMQAAAVARLVELGSGGNFSVPGSGKTTMTLAVYAALRARGLVDRLLVLAPLSAHEAWQVDVDACFGDAQRPIAAIRPTAWRRLDEMIVVNYERASQAVGGARFERWALGHRVMVVFDEAHRAKRGRAGLHGAAAAALADRAEHRIVLTGTPMPNGPADLAAVLDLAWPGHGKDLARDVDPSKEGVPWVRVTKADLGLADPELTLERVRLDDVHMRLYTLVAGQAAGLADEAVFGEHPELARQAILRTLAVGTNPAALLDERLSWSSVNAPVPAKILEAENDIRVLARGAKPTKLLRAAEIARSHAESGEKLLMWTNFLANVEELKRLCAPYGVAVVTGDTAVEDEHAETDRERELDRFRHDPACTVLIATPQTLGEGVSLHRACQSQLHVDRTFNAGLFLQALDRTHRVGMPEGTVARATVLVAEDTLDERVDAVLRAKIDAMRKALDDHSLEVLALPDDGVDTSINADIIKQLTAHLR